MAEWRLPVEPTPPVDYPLMEHFYTLQGEGLYSGQAAYFLRLGGCDVGCHWCDVKESWDATQHPVVPLGAIGDFLKVIPAPIVVVTGGEPTLHNLEPLTQLIHTLGKRTHMETAGTNAITGSWDWITLSPKKFKAPLEENLQKADELKIIIYNQSDFAWAEQFAAQVRPDCKCYLQVEWSKRDKMTAALIRYIQEHPRWQLSVQTHKYLDIP